MIKQMQYAGITVTDIEQAKDFYLNELGSKLLVENPLPGDNQFIMVCPAGGGSSLVLTLPFPGREHKPAFGIAFTADNVEKTYAGLRKSGIVFKKEPVKTPWGGMEALFTDPFGNSFILHEE